MEHVVTLAKIDSLKAYSSNARTHSKTQIRKIASSISTFGFTSPVLLDSENTIIAGHGRVEAARLLGLDQVPTIRLHHLTPAQVRAYVIADNKLALYAGWNEDILRIEFANIALDGTVQIGLTGFEIAEIDLIIGGRVADEPADTPPDDEALRVSKLGDLWQLGEHRVLCGDARDAVAFSKLMSDQRAAAVFADPPYNVAIDGHASGNGRTHHPEFVMASGEMSKMQFTEFLLTAITQLAAWSTDGSVHYLCMDWRHLSEMLSAGGQVYDRLLNLCVWAKDNGGMGSFYRSQHELIFIFKNGRRPFRNNIQLGKFGRNRTNVWHYPGANTFSRSADEGNLLQMHPTVKPIALIADAILDCTARGDIVLDSFLGSGSTLMAAERVGRVCYGMELEPRYVDMAIRRWQAYTGERAVHVLTGRPFGEIAVVEVENG